MLGKTKLTQKEIDVLRGMVNYICEECLKHENEVGTLEPHRITPGNKGGLYCPHNIKMCCSSCHGYFSSAERMVLGIQ